MEFIQMSSGYMEKYKMYKKDYNLRHTTIVAHGFEGINEDKLNEMLKRNGENGKIKSYFEELRKDFYNLTKTDDTNIFNEINEKIINKL